MQVFFERISRFCRDTSANVAMMFGLASLGLLGAAGLALDYTNAETMRTRMAAAADSAVLAAAAATGKTEAERLALAQKQFDAGIGVHAGIQNIVLTGNDVMESGSVVGFRVNVSGAVPTTLGRIFGMSALPVAVGAQATSGASERIEMALVLDKTGSMAGSKMIALQTAANDMINSLLAKAATPGQVRFAIAPFAEHVQVGLHRAGEPWLHVPAPVTTNSCWNTYPDATSSNCRMETRMHDGTPVQVNVCDWNYGTPVEVCGTTTQE